MKTSTKILTETHNVRHGSNGFYDIRLLEQNDTSLLIEVELSIFFKFIPLGSNPGITWSQAERDFFVSEWLRQISSTWSQQNYTTLNGSDLSIEFVSSIQQEASGTQWQANVMKLESRNAFRTSAVGLNSYPDKYDAKFDSNDDLLKFREGGQTAMIHEFGHMIGLPDEYKRTSQHHADENSVMNVGSEIRERHLSHFVQWARQQFNGNQQEQLNHMDAFKLIAEATTKEEELDAVQAWIDAKEPDESFYFVVRKRDTQEEIAIKDIMLYDVEDLEVEFMSDEDAEAELNLWQPKSLDSLQMLLLE